MRYSRLSQRQPPRRRCPPAPARSENGLHVAHPNGLSPAKDGSLLMVGSMSAEQRRGIYSISADGKITTLAKDLDRLDGLYQMDDGTLLITDWNSGSLLRWSAKGVEALVKGSGLRISR